jgi:hypothetical protein
MRQATRRLLRSIFLGAALAVVGASAVIAGSIVAPSTSASVSAAEPAVLYIGARDTVATCCVNTFQFWFADIGTDLSVRFGIVNEENRAVEVVGFEPGAGVSIDPGDCSPGTSIPKGGRCHGELRVPYTESYEIGVQHRWTYRILTDLAGSPRELAVEGGWAPFEMQQPDLLRGSSDLGYAEVGEESSMTAVVEFAKKDHYDRVIATVTGVTVIGEDPDSFRVSLTSTWPSAMCDSVESFVICEVRVVGRPTHTGVNRATVRFSAIGRDGVERHADFDVSVTGAVGSLEVDGDRTMEIKDAPLYRTLSRRTITWRNTSDGLAVHVDRVQLRDLDPDADPFRVVFELEEDGCDRVTLDPGETCSVTIGIRTRSTTIDSVRLVPTTSASERDEATITVSTAPVGLLVDPEGAEPASIRFGDRPIGSRISKSVEIISLGTSSLTGIDWDLTGHGDLSVRDDSCADRTLAPATPDVASSCQLTVRFAPTGLGDRTATLVVSADGVDPVEVSLSGEGTEAMPLATPSQVTFGAMRNGTFRDASIVIGDRTPPFKVLSVRVTGGIETPEPIRSDCTGRTVGDEPCTLVVRYWAIRDDQWSRIEIETDLGTTISIPVTASLASDFSPLEVLDASDQNLPDPEYLSTWHGETVTARFWVTNVSSKKLRIGEAYIEDRTNHEGADAPEPIGWYAVASGSGCRNVYLEPGGTCVAKVSYTGDQSREGESDSQLVLRLDDGNYPVFLGGSTYPRSTFGIDAPEVVDLELEVATVGKGSVAARSVDAVVDQAGLAPDTTIAGVSPVVANATASGTARARWLKRVKPQTDTKDNVFEVQVRRGTGAWKTVQRSKLMSASISVGGPGTSVRVRSRNGGKVSRWLTASVAIGIVADQRQVPRGWKRVNDSASLGGYVVRNAKRGSKLSFRRSWTEVGVVARPSHSSTFEAWVDGRKVRTVTVTKKAGLRRAVVFQIGYVTKKIRRFEIRVRSGTLDVDGWIIKDRVPTP